MYYFAVLIGAIIFLLLELNKAIVKKEFTVYQFIQLNWLAFMTNVVVGVAIIFIKDDISEYYTINKLSALFLGVGGQAIFKKIYGVFTDKIGTAIGINKE